MKFLIFLTAVFALSLAKSASLLNRNQITEELIKNPRFLLTETENGLFEVEDLEASQANLTLTLAANDVTFYIYTPENHAGTQIRANQVRDIVRLTRFNVNRNTVVIIHGWRNNFNSAVNTGIRQALLQSRNINIIVVDWSGIASGSYINSQGSVLAIGNFIGDFLIQLNNDLGHSLNRITLVGHSLGAHISGNAGARAIGLVNTIVGLDPAGPLFSANNINNRLDPTDGQNVHVIHTNDGLLGFGIRMGHADYYPNGGSTQPGCGIDIAGSCAHSRAYIYYAESVNNNNFFSRKCETYNLYQNNHCNLGPSSFLGNYPVSRASRDGNYFLLTNDRSPFARG